MRFFERSAQIPFARHVSVIAGRPENLGERGNGFAEVAFVSGHADAADVCIWDSAAVVDSLDPHRANARPVIGGAGEQHGTRGSAAGRGMKIRKAQSVERQIIQVRRVNFAPPGTEFVITHVVCDDQYDVRSLRDRYCNWFLGRFGPARCQERKQQDDGDGSLQLQPGFLKLGVYRRQSRFGFTTQNV